MHWSWLNWAYTFCLTVGSAYTVIAFFLGHFGVDHSHDAGGADMGGPDANVGGNVGHIGADHSYHFPLLSPLVISMFFTAFGAGGIIGLELLKGRHPATSLGPAFAAAFVFAFSLGLVMTWVFRKTGGTSHATDADILGSEATVTITIPSGGVGKIAYEARGTRFTAPARTHSGTEIRQDALVTIRAIEGHVLVVDPQNRS